MINRELLSALPDLLKKRLRRAMGSTRGFTLIEVLIVVAILAILVSLVLPAVLGQTTSARSVAKRSDLKEVEKAVDKLLTATYERAQAQSTN